MEVMRKIIKIDDYKINLSFPVKFNSKYVEIIIMPYEKFDLGKNVEEEKNIKLNDFQKLLLSAPVMTDEEHKYFLEKKQNFKLWK